jgi:hypothetical protein
MTPEVDGNKEFAQWFGEWTARIQQRRASVQQLQLDNLTRAGKAAVEHRVDQSNRVRKSVEESRHAHESRR